VHPRAATYAVVSDHTSLQRWAPAPLCVPRPRTSPPCCEELRRCHVFLSFGPRFPAEMGSGAFTCPMAPGSASPRGEFRCYHISHGLQQAMDHRNKERLTCPRHTGRLACFQGMFVRY
jgi:hypothetical protein